MVEDEEPNNFFLSEDACFDDDDDDDDDDTLFLLFPEVEADAEPAVNADDAAAAAAATEEEEDEASALVEALHSWMRRGRKTGSGEATGPSLPYVALPHAYTQ